MRVATIILATLLAACGRVPSISESEAFRIEAAANQLLLVGDSARLESDAWPEAIQRLSPETLRVDPDASTLSRACGLLTKRACLFRAIPSCSPRLRAGTQSIEEFMAPCMRTAFVARPNNALQATCETHARERRRWAGKSQTDDDCVH